MPKIPFWIFILLALLYFSSVRVDTMDIDASQQAEISREMMVSHDYFHLYDRGKDYLDKPPFLFQASSVSMLIFGVNNFGYKFPSILFALLALFAVYRLTRLLYNEETGRLAALILGTCQGFFLMTNDIRTDTILMGWTITSIWLIKEWEVHGKLKHLLLGAACIAFGMMTKGPVAIMVPVFCFASDWVLKREWRYFFKPQYIWVLIVIAILLIPMSIGLYQQFDMHPERHVNGSTHISGLRFFYWSQSFGRITGESPWSNGAGFDFLMSNMLWMFLPWILLFFTALIINVVGLVKQGFKLNPKQEWLSTGGFIITYCSLASSHYQLPHYLYIAFPLAAIITAALIKDLFDGKYKAVYAVAKPAQVFVSLVLFTGALMAVIYVFPARQIVIIAWGLCFLFWLFLAFRKQLQYKMVWLSVAAIMIANIFLTNHFYTALLKYQVGSQVGRYIQAKNIPSNKILAYRMQDPLDALPLYAQRVIPVSDTMLLSIQPGTQYILTMDTGMNELATRGYLYDTIKHSKLFKVSELTPEFLNPATRDHELKDYYLLRLKNNG